MKNTAGIGKGIATAGMWVGVAVLAYIFTSAEILSEDGAVLMVVGAFVMTGVLWVKDFF